MSTLFQNIDTKWQAYWAKNQTFAALDQSTLPKYYILDMFPYPSGAGLHVGHPLGYIASDIVARYKRHQGYNVLHPQGYDSFGLPAEQYAIQTGQHPAITTETNINRYRQQLDQIGFSFDWSREVRTSNPEYYKWTQWIFSELFQSWYNVETNQAESIDQLVTHFETQGTQGVSAVCADETPHFSAQEWQEWDEVRRQEILLDYRLTYLADIEVNWCPKLGTVLANDEIVNGVSERGGYPVVRKKMRQWIMRISAYAERLLDGLDRLEWSEALKEVQRNWIGKSIGASVHFDIDGHDDQIKVFTTRPDTLFGVSFMTLAPEHDLVQQITTDAQKAEVDDYIDQASRKSERERMTEVKQVSGVFTGAYALHPFTQERIPVWIGDYVLAGYGTGAVMAVPCGDQRDYEFAHHFNLPIPNIFKGVDLSEQAFNDKDTCVIDQSDFLTGLSHKEAMHRVIEELETQGCGHGKINYRLRDAVFSRQRYWGEPFPIYYKAGMPCLIDLEYLPLILPDVEKYLPTEEGAPPLGNAEKWAWDEVHHKVVSCDQIDHQTVFPLELNTMPGWAGSSWYFNRYMDAHNSTAFASQEALNYWQEVDLYLGGSEHATGHLLYARFWQKFLFDRSHVPVDEFAKKLVNQGMILGTSAFAYRKRGTQTYVSFDLCAQNAKSQWVIASTLGQDHEEYLDPIHIDVSLLINATDEIDIEGVRRWRSQFAESKWVTNEKGQFWAGRDVEKMSKSKYNVVNPDEICQTYGADTLRLYEMFLGPLEQAKPWNTAGLSGVYGFLKKFWKLFHTVGKEQGTDQKWSVVDDQPSAEALKSLHKVIKKVTEDIENFSFNTSISAFMICANELGTQKCRSRSILEPLTVLLSPFAPHLCEELWEKLGHSESIERVPYPLFEEQYLIESTKVYPISFKGKVRFTLTLPVQATRDEIEAAVFADERTAKQLQGATPKKVIIVPGRIVNIVF
jgi:leucyl-tRNA synthetase